MTEAIERYSEQLRTLGDAYYHGHITYAEYRQQRDRIFTDIETDVLANDASQRVNDDKMLDRILSCFKVAEKDEHAG